MKKLIITTLILSFCIAAFAANVALLSAAKGKVDLTRAAKVAKVKLGDYLQNNDEIRTGGESFAAYKYVDGSTNIKVFSNSVVKVSATSSGKTLVKKATITKGSVFSSIKPNSGTYSMQTPTTVASVKGTGFLTKITKDKQSMFVVTEGEVTLKILNESQTVSVNAGKTAIVEADGRYEVRQSTPEDLSEIELAEIESSRARDNKTLRIPMVDPSGRTRYIEIKY
jgi:hypothetical protein